MIQTSENSLWRVHGASIRGDQHARMGLPNQDAIGWWPETRRGQRIVVAVSDGHGSPKSFRSDIGASLAVECSIRVLQNLLDSWPNSSSLANLKRLAEERLPREITQEWRKCVAAHLEQNSFTSEELTHLREASEPGAEQTIADNPYHAYGATLLCALLTERFVLFVQIGDGDILCVDSIGQTSRPLPKDARLLANETTSLCLPDAWRDFEIRLMPLVDEQRVLSMLLLCTDGYANSFRSEADFLKIGPDYLHMVRTMGSSAVQHELAGFLEEASHKGSGDDITLCIVKRHEETDLDAFQKEVLQNHAEFDRRIAAIQSSLAEVGDTLQEKVGHAELAELEHRQEQAAVQTQKAFYLAVAERTEPLQLELQQQAAALRRVAWLLAALFVGLVVSFSLPALLLWRSQGAQTEAPPLQLNTATPLPATLGVSATVAPLVQATLSAQTGFTQTATTTTTQSMSSTVIIPIEIPTVVSSAAAGEPPGNDLPAVLPTKPYTAHGTQ